MAKAGISRHDKRAGRTPKHRPYAYCMYVRLSCAVVYSCILRYHIRTTGALHRLSVISFSSTCLSYILATRTFGSGAPTSCSLSAACPSPFLLRLSCMCLCFPAGASSTSVVIWPYLRLSSLLLQEVTLGNGLIRERAMERLCIDDFL